MTDAMDGFWAVHCHDCAHEKHPLARCAEIIGSDGGTMPEPVYCECFDAGKAEAEIARLRGLLARLEAVAGAARNVMNIGRAHSFADDWDRLRAALVALDGAS
jgi:hypothetical protein